jgi:phosphoribosylformimino-5-aminoimidazole carboxamide ribotide isomerase
MILYPAIDLKGGACVRLLHGDMSTATEFNDDPADQAKKFIAAGCKYLHVVDLDGAFAGKSVNSPAVEQIVGAAIAASGDVKVQLGGGIRDEAGIEHWLTRGVTRVILGTIALRDPDFVKRACGRWPGRIAVGIDARGGRVAVTGWSETSDVKTLDLALKFEQSGVAAIIFTDISRDGAMQGPNIEATVDLAFQLTTPVIASGGVSNLADLKELKKHENSGISGVICGRSLYDGRIKLAEAVKLLQGDGDA